MIDPQSFDPVEAAARLLRYITTPGLIEAEMAEDRRRMIEAWKADPYYPIRVVRAHGVEPSEVALNCLDGPCICEICGATLYEDGEEMVLPCDLCMGCGHITCDRDSCQTPGWCVSKHPFSLHRSKLAHIEPLLEPAS